MAINTGVNVSKLNGYAVLSIPVGVDVTKLIAYVVLDANLRITAADSLNNWSDTSSYTLLSTGVTVSDTLSFSDLITLRLNHLLSISDILTLSDSFTGYSTKAAIGFSDSLNNWLDTTNRTTSIVVGNLTRSVADKWSIDTKPNSPNLWRDGFSRLQAGQQIVLATDDIIDATDQLYLDANFVPLTPFTDTLALSDEVRVTIGITVTPTDAFDAMYLTDAVLVSVPAYFQLIFTDTLNNWADQSIIYNPVNNTIGDSLSLSDRVNISLSIALNISDTLVMSDSLSNSSFINISDAMIMSDDGGISIILFNMFDGTTSDDLNNWSDNIGFEFRDAQLLDYYRRYLGDIFRGSN